MWIAIFGAFVLVAVLFGKPEHRGSSARPVQAQPTIAAVVEPGLAPHAAGASATYRRD